MSFLEFSDVLKFYSNPKVKKEISEYCKERWAAIECAYKEGKRVFLRYMGRGGPPLTINSTEELGNLMKRFKVLRPRTFYASINKYMTLKSVEDTDNMDNIRFSSPIWDVDGSETLWRETLDIAETIINYLESEGVEKSIFLKWSGRGVHIHLNEKAFSSEILDRYNPLDVAFSVVEYILRKKSSEIREKIGSYEPGKRIFKVENKIDLKRVFTCPLSLHREKDLCCVCFKPSEIQEFSIEWTNPYNFRHNSDWRVYAEGEADNLALKALSEVRGYRQWTLKHSVVSVGKITRKTGKRRVEALAKQRLGRFQVMALLQAARFYILTGDEEKAKSFGLNRAIFYAWAKHRRVRGPPLRSLTGEKEAAVKRKEGKLMYVGDEGAYISENGWFAIGGSEQTPKDYQREIERKINAVVPYSKAWEAAVKYLKGLPNDALLRQQKFFNSAYKPVRDKFLEIVTRQLG